MPAFRGPCRGAGRVLGPGIGPTELQACLPAVLIEPGLAQRHPSMIPAPHSVSKKSQKIVKDFINSTKKNVWRSTRLTASDDSDEDCFSHLDSKGIVTTSPDKCRFTD